MRVYRFLTPYKKDGKTNFPESHNNRPGVYLIKENDKLVYIGYSGFNLYKTMYRHFQEWKDDRQYRVSYANKMKRNRYTVRLIYCTPVQAERLEMALIIKHKPRDNGNKYDAYILEKLDHKIIDDYQFTAVQGPEAPF